MRPEHPSCGSLIYSLYAFGAGGTKYSPSLRYIPVVVVISVVTITVCVTVMVVYCTGTAGVLKPLEPEEEDDAAVTTVTLVQLVVMLVPFASVTFVQLSTTLVVLPLEVLPDEADV